MRKLKIAAASVIAISLIFLLFMLWVASFGMFFSGFSAEFPLNIIPIGVGLFFILVLPSIVFLFWDTGKEMIQDFKQEIAK